MGVKINAIKMLDTNYKEPWDGGSADLGCFKVLIRFGRKVERVISLNSLSNVLVKNIRVNYQKGNTMHNF